MPIIDITLPLKPKMTVYPGNPDFKSEPFQSLPLDSSNVSLITFGTHTGTHIDAPLHVKNNDQSVDQISLETLIGESRVFDLSHVKDAVRIEHLKPYNIQSGERIVIKTYNSVRGWDTWYDNYVYLDGDAAQYLADIGITLLGIDYFSVKQRGSKDTRPHDALLNNHIPVLEALKLDQVEQGTYNLIALPLPFYQGDGSPVRACLVRQSP